MQADLTQDLADKGPVPIESQAQVSGISSFV